MGEKIEYFFAALDMHLGDGLEPAQALAEAAADYAYVWNAGNPGTPLSKASERALLHIEQWENPPQADDQRGFYLKYIVTHADGSPLSPGMVFVLRPDRDPAAYNALDTYAETTKNWRLRDDLRAWLHEHPMPEDDNAD